MQSFTLEEFTDLIKSGNSMNYYATSDILEGKFNPQDTIYHLDESELPNTVDKGNLLFLSTEGGYDFYEGSDSICLFIGDKLMSVYSTMPNPFIKMQSNRTPTKEKEYAITVGEIIDYAKKHKIDMNTELAYGAAGVYNPIVEFESEDRSLVLIDNTIYKSWKWTDSYTKKIKRIKDLKQYKVDLPVRYKFNENPVNINSCYLDVYGGTNIAVLGLNINGINEEGQLVKEHSGLVKLNGKLNYAKAFKQELSKNIKNNSVFDIVGALAADPLKTYLSYKQLKELTKGLAIKEPSSYNTRTTSFTRNRDGSISFSKDNSMVKTVRYFSKVDANNRFFQAGQKLANDKPNLPKDELEQAAKDAGVPEVEMTQFLFGYNSIDKKAPDFVAENSAFSCEQNVARFSKGRKEPKNVVRFSLFKPKVEHAIFDGKKTYVVPLDIKNAVERSAFNLGRLLKDNDAVAFKSSDGPVYVAFYSTGELTGLLCIDMTSDDGDISKIYEEVSKYVKNKTFKKLLLEKAKDKVPYICTALFDASYEDKWVSDMVKLGNNKWFGDKISDLTVKKLNATL